MRILIATDHYPPFIGGAHRQARLLAVGMAERGHQVAVATPWHGGLPTVTREGEVAVHRVRQLRTVVPALVRDGSQRHQPPFPDPVTVLGLRRVIRRFNPDLIHAYGWFAFSVRTTPRPSVSPNSLRVQMTGEPGSRPRAARLGDWCQTMAATVWRPSFSSQSISSAR